MGQDEKVLIDTEDLSNRVIQDLTELGTMAADITTIEALKSAVWPGSALEALQTRLSEVNEAWSAKLTALEAELEEKRTASVTELTDLRTKLQETIAGDLQIAPAGPDTYTVGGYVRDSKSNKCLPFIAVKVHQPEGDFATHTFTDDLGTFKVDIDAATISSLGVGATLLVTAIDETGNPVTASARTVTPVIGEAETVTVSVLASQAAPSSLGLSSAMFTLAARFADSLRYRSDTIDARLISIKRRT